MEKRTFLLHFTDAELQALRASVSATRGAVLREGLEADRTDAGTLEALERELQYARPRTLEELVSFGTDRLREDYYSDVRSMAEDVLSQVLDEETDEDAAREALEERLWESVDGSAWVIYTARALDVLRVSENEGYALEEWGTDGILEDGAIQWSRLAFGALYADVSERLWADFEEWKERREDFESELQERALSLSDVELRDSGGSFADRFLVSLSLPDGDALHFRMSVDATSPGGVCQTCEGPGPEESKQRGSILAPDVPDAVRTQVLRILDDSRRECGATLARYAEELSSMGAELADLRALATRTDFESARMEELSEQVSTLEGAREELRELAEAWGIDVETGKEGA